MLIIYPSAFQSITPISHNNLNASLIFGQYTFLWTKLPYWKLFTNDKSIAYYEHNKEYLNADSLASIKPQDLIRCLKNCVVVVVVSDKPPSLIPITIISPNPHVNHPIKHERVAKPLNLHANTINHGSAYLWDKSERWQITLRLNPNSVEYW